MECQGGARVWGYHCLNVYFYSEAATKQKNVRSNLLSTLIS